MYNLSEVLPLMRLKIEDWIEGQKTLEANSSKMVKYEKTCLKNIFIRFMFDTFDYLTLEGTDCEPFTKG